MTPGERRPVAPWVREFIAKQATHLDQPPIPEEQIPRLSVIVLSAFSAGLFTAYAIGLALA